MSKLETITIDTPSGSNTMQIGSTNTSTINLGVSGDTINVPAGVTIANAGTATGFGGANTPAFEAYLNTTQDIGDGVMTKITANVERFDTDSAYDHSSNYRFTPQTAGKYYVYLEAVGYSTTGGDTNIIVAYGEIRKNGSRYIYNVDHQPSYGVRQQTINISGIIDMNGSSDYVEPFAEVNVSSGNGTLRGNSDGSLNTKFGAFRIIT